MTTFPTFGQRAKTRTASAAGVAEAITAERAARRALAEAEEAEAAARLTAAGGVRALSRDAYAREKTAWISRLRRR